MLVDALENLSPTKDKSSNFKGEIMANPRNKTQELESLYDLRDKLLQENNELVFKAYKISEQIDSLQKQEQTPEDERKIKDYSDELPAINKKLVESKVAERIEEVREKIKVLETEVFGQPLSDSPHARKPR